MSGESNVSSEIVLGSKFNRESREQSRLSAADIEVQFET